MIEEILGILIVVGIIAFVVDAIKSGIEGHQLRDEAKEKVSEAERLAREDSYGEAIKKYLEAKLDYNRASNLLENEYADEKQEPVKEVEKEAGQMVDSVKSNCFNPILTKLKRRIKKGKSRQNVGIPRKLPKLSMKRTTSTIWQRD